MNNTEQKKHKHSPSDKKMLVRYGKGCILGWFRHNEKDLPREKGKVMIKTERGLEIGEVVGKFCYKSGVFKKSEQAVGKYYTGQTEDSPVTDGGKFVRYATAQDLSEEKHINTNAQGEFRKCHQMVKEMKLPMKMVDIEHVFGGERIIFYFTAESRVDFRDLVKQLAREFQTRIEMRQVGSRDAAKITADIEVCGQPCCCARYLKILKPVNMKMAKLQKATLDPAKISGYCGRLKCCLRYEDHTYRDLSKNLPKRKARVKTEHGEGIVINTQVLTQLISIRKDDGSVFAIPAEEVTVIPTPQQNKQPNKQSDNRRPNNKNNNRKSENRPSPDKDKQRDNSDRTDES